MESSLATIKTLPEGSQTLALIFKAVADPLRLEILRVLSQESFGVLELASIFNLPQPGMSHHLKVLAKAGLVLTRRQGNIIFYRRTLVRASSPYPQLLQSLFRTIDDITLSPAVDSRIQKIYDARASASRLYFERHLDQFSQNQGLLCQLEDYLPNLKEVLDAMQLTEPSLVMEVGPGQGQLLQELVNRFDQLIALDNSQEMLDCARLGIAENNKIMFVKGAFEDYPTDKTAFEAVILNMVLHHLPSPLAAFQKAHQLLNRGGYLVIADLCLHHQEWVRSACGDIWLGFDPQELTDWASQAGFREEESLYLGLKNGFQIQIKLFRS